MNTKLFLSHGDLESIFKAIYSGIPVLCLALFGDQLKSALKLKEVGTDFYVDKLTFTSNSFSEQIKTIIEDKNDKFQLNLLRMKTISHYSSKKLDYPADLLEQYIHTAKSCRKYKPYDASSNLSPCEIKHLILVSYQMSFISAEASDIYISIILLLLSTIVLLIYCLYHFLIFLFTYYKRALRKSKMK